MSVCGRMRSSLNSCNIDMFFRDFNYLREIVVTAGSLDAYKAAPALAPYVDLIVEDVQ